MRIRDMAGTGNTDRQRKEKHRATARDDVRSHEKTPHPQGKWRQL
jgi:hypothetical protein